MGMTGARPRHRRQWLKF
jgi:hypothetical protein